MRAIDELRAVLSAQSLAVVATDAGGCPYTSLVGFAVSDDLRRITFVTSRATTKFRNLSANPRVAMLIDSRTHSVEDFSTGTAVTAIGQAAEVPRDEAERAVAGFLRKHPHLESFVRSPSTAICAVDVATYIVVTRFQHVVELDVTQWPSSSSP